MLSATAASPVYGELPKVGGAMNAGWRAEYDHGVSELGEKTDVRDAFRRWLAPWNRRGVTIGVSVCRSGVIDVPGVASLRGVSCSRI